MLHSVVVGANRSTSSIGSRLFQGIFSGGGRRRAQSARLGPAPHAAATADATGSDVDAGYIDNFTFQPPDARSRCE